MQLSRLCAFCTVLSATRSALTRLLSVTPFAERITPSSATIRSSADRRAYQMSIVRIAANSVIASRYDVTEGPRCRTPVGLREAVVACRDRDTRREALHVVFERTRERLVEVVQVEHQRPLRRRIEAEVRKIRVAAELHVESGGRSVLQVGGHDLRRAPVERERRDHHPAVANGHEIRLAGGVLRLEQRHRIRAVRVGRPARVVRQLRPLVAGLPDLPFARVGARVLDLAHIVHNAGHRPIVRPGVRPIITLSG